MITGRAARLLGKVRERATAHRGSPSLDLWWDESAVDIAAMRPAEVEVHEAAVRAAGYHDFGDVAYRASLARLLDSIDASGYTEAQKRRIRGNLIVRVLRSRLYSERGWRERPDALLQPLAAPVIVVGLPRTGTTALHKLLAADPALQGLNGWLVSYPMPRPARETWSARPEYRAVLAAEEAAMGSSTMKTAHVRTADDVDEPLELISQSFVSNYFPAICRLPDYDEWFRAQDLRETYLRFANNLRLVGANEPDKRWLLQNPSNILRLEDLLSVFPDAKLIWTHRSPGEAIASLTSLLTAVRRAVLIDPVSGDDIAEREVGLWSKAVVEATDVHDRHPENFVDVDFRNFVRDPVGVVRKIYEGFDLVLSREAESAMRRWITENPQGKQGTHEYSREQYGLTPARMEASFGGYLARFGLPS